MEFCKLCLFVRPCSVYLSRTETSAVGFLKVYWRTLCHVLKGLIEPLQRTHLKLDIKVISKPLKTLQREFPSLKDRPNIDEQTNIVYKIPCKECSWSYNGETGRSLKTRKSEHLRNVEHCKKGSNVAKHAWTYDHIIDFANPTVIDSGSYRTRKTLESWLTATTKNADNDSMLLPGQYTMLTKK